MQDHKEIVEACIRGERKAQRELYELFSRRLYFVCLRYAQSDQEAEDILQESFIKIFENLGKFRGDSRVEYWMKRIVVNTALNQRRNKLYMYPMVDVEEVGQKVEYDQVLSECHYDDLLHMIRTLPAGSRVVFNLYAVEGYSHKEIAEMLDISEGTSKSQYFRAKELLKKKLLEEQIRKYEQYK